MNTIRASLNQDFVYFFGRLAIVKQNLLNESQINRLVSADTMQDFVQIITELPFTKFINQGLQLPEEIFIALEQWIQREIANGIPVNKQKIFFLPWLENFSSAVSIVLKKQQGFVSYNAQTDVSNMVLMLENSINGVHTNAVPTEVLAILKNLLTMQFSSPQQIDTSVAMKFAAMSIAHARESKNDNIISYVQCKIDCINIKNALRYKNDTEFTVIPGGKIAITSFKKSIGELSTDIVRAGYIQLATITNENNTIEQVEQMCAKCITQTIRSMWSVPMSMDFAFAFVVTAINHITTVRTMYIGKKNDLTAMEISQILPPFIPASIYSA